MCCDPFDEIVEMQCSLTIGVANEVCNIQARKEGYPINKLGILEKETIESFIEDFLDVLNLE